MKVVAPATLAVAGLFLAGLAVPAAGGGKPAGDRAPAVGGSPALALGTVSLARLGSAHRTGPKPPVRAIGGGRVTAGHAGHVTSGDAAGGSRPPVEPEGIWKAATAPVPAGAATQPDAFVSAVTCSSATACVAAGAYLDSSGNYQGLLLTRRGPSWTAAEAPLPADAGDSPGVNISAVACPSATACTAVGGYADSSGNYQGLLLTRRGSSWTAAEAPLPAGGAFVSSSGGLSGVACRRAWACVAIGGYTDSSGNDHGLLLTRRGSSWTAARAPLPAGAATGSEVSISEVACWFATACVAVGTYGDLTGRSPVSDGLLLTRRGSSWTAARAPLPADAASDPLASISAIACPLATTCAASGSYSDTAGNDQGLLLTRRGPSWTAARAPLPADAASDPLTSISAIACPLATTCAAIGSYRDSSDNIDGLLLTGPGPSWTAAKAPLPANAAASPVLLTSVACQSAGCVAAGSYLDPSGRGLLLTGPA
jgi:hypothetical protein